MSSFVRFFVNNPILFFFAGAAGISAYRYRAAKAHFMEHYRRFDIERLMWLEAMLLDDDIDDDDDDVQDIYGLHKKVYIKAFKRLEEKR